MKFLIFILFIFWYTDTFSQIQYYNHNDCDKYTHRKWDSIAIDDLRIPKMINKFSISDYYNFKDSIKDISIIKNLKSNILINDLLLFNDCFENNCICDYKDNLDTVNHVFSRCPLKFKILGKFKPSPNIISLIILVQLPKDTIEIFENKEMNAYLLNFDNSYFLLSTANIGHFVKSSDGLSHNQTNSKIYIKDNIIILNEATSLFPTDIGMHLSKSDFTENKIYKIHINENGQIEQ